MTYKIAEDNSAYPDRLFLWHYENVRALDKSGTDPARIAFREDQESLSKKYGAIPIWRAGYELQMSFRNGACYSPAGKENTLTDRAPFIHLDAFDIAAGKEDRLEAWFNGRGYDMFIPIVMEIPGIKGYDFYKWLGDRPEMETAKEKDYPLYLSIQYFENAEAYNLYEKSPELAAFKKAIENTFPGSVTQRWSVSYLILSSIENTPMSLREDK